MEVSKMEAKDLEKVLTNLVQLFDLALKNKGFTLRESLDIFNALQYSKNLAEQYVFTQNVSDKKLDIPEIQQQLELINSGLAKACENGAFSMNNAVVANVQLNVLVEFVKQRVVPVQQNSDSSDSNVETLSKA